MSRTLPHLPLFEQSPFSMVLYDMSGRPLRANASFEQLFGMKLGDAPPDYSVRADAELLRQGFGPLIERAFAGEAVRIGPVHYDTPAAHGTGKPTWTYGYFFPFEAFGVRYVALQHVDLTEMVETETALRYATRRYAALVQASASLVWNTDATGMVEDMPQWRELTGQTVEEVRGEGWANAIHPDDSADTREAWWKAYELRSVYTAEYRLRMKSGAYRWVRAQGVPILDDTGAIAEWVGTLVDVHDEHVAAERARFLDEISLVLNDQSLDLERTLNALARKCVPFIADYASVDLLSPAGEIRRLAMAHVDPGKELVLREMWQRYPYQPTDPYGVPQMLRTGEPMLMSHIDWREHLYVGRDADHLRMIEQLDSRSYIGVALVARGRVIGALSLVYSESGRHFEPTDVPFVKDIATRAASAVENARLYQEAGDANRAKADFLAMMSHELRTPLNAISGYAELLEMEVHGPINEEQRQAIGRIQRGQRHLLALVNDVLNFARIEAGSVPYNIRCVELAPVLADAESAVRNQVRTRGLAYEEQLAPAKLHVLADPEKVLQILLNLLSNALKFTSEGGTIVVSTDADDTWVRIRVSDTGKGIPADKLGVIFEPFVQLDRGLTRSMEGAGLGLSISADLARGMKGDLGVTSTEGKGTTFTLTLPRCESEGRG